MDVHVVLGWIDELRVAQNGIPAGFHHVNQLLDPIAYARDVQVVVLLVFLEGLQSEVNQGVVQLFGVHYILLVPDIHIQNRGGGVCSAGTDVSRCLRKRSVTQDCFVTPVFQPLNQFLSQRRIRGYEDEGLIQVHGGVEIVALLQLQYGNFLHDFTP